MAEQQQRLSIGILVDILDEEWMRETLPHDDIPLPSDMVARTEDSEEPNHESQPSDADTWHELALLEIHRPPAQ